VPQPDAPRQRNERHATYQVTLTVTDGAGATDPGAVGMTSYLSGSVTHGPIVLPLSALSARPAA
jgi:hypothetical protein